MDGLSGSKNQVPKSGGKPETKGVETASYLHPTIDKCQVLVSSYVVFFTMSCLVFFNKFASCNDPLLSFTVLIEKVTGARHKPQTPSSAHHLPTQSVTSQADTLDCHLSSGTGTPSCHTSAFTACALEQLSSCSRQRKPPPYKPYYGDNWATLGQKLVKAQRGIHP